MEQRPYRYKNHSGHGIVLGGFISLLFVAIFAVGCSEKSEISPPPEEEEPADQKVEGVDYFLPHIDLNNWKVTLPIGNPTEVEPPEVLNYGNLDILREFMYNDSIDGSLVFYTYPGASTRNSSYSRTELREQMVPGSNNTNWTFAEGGRMRGTLMVPEISKDEEDKFHRTIIMQIHGRLTNEQRDLIREDDNNAPPVLKIYWQNGKIRVKTKVLNDLETNDVDILKTSSWGNDEGVYFDQAVGHDKFTVEVIVSEGRMEVILNDQQSLVYDDIHMQKWGVFENYFKAGNYLQAKGNNDFAKVKYYELAISH